MNTEIVGELKNDLCTCLSRAAADAAAHLQLHCSIRRKSAIFTLVTNILVHFATLTMKLRLGNAFKANPLLLLQTVAAAAAVCCKIHPLAFIYDIAEEIKIAG